ncbi:MAG: GTP-binding protein [Candidatus Omnitrophota bacterium]|jgi:GTP-binding protein
MSLSIRNIGIIAHVDHGKTTLVDKILQQAGAYRDNQAVEDRAMDSMDLEKEKGITIKSKNAMVKWNDVTINIVDTPGHADFGGEVERILQMVDGVLVLVDAQEGPQAQTRFVMRKAIAQNLPLIVVVNKIDREFADPLGMHDKMLELLMELDASEDQFNSPFIYGSARDGYMLYNPDDEPEDMSPLFETVIKHIPPPSVNADGPFEMLVSNLDWSDYVGRIGVGKLSGGSVRIGDAITRIGAGGKRTPAKITKIYKFTGMGVIEDEQATTGEIAGLAGFDELNIGETLAGNPDQEPLPFVEIDPPTIQMQFCVNDGPFAGKEGKFVTARAIGDRLIRETRTNVSLEVEESEQLNSYNVSARGELQIAVVVETMRREGFELMVSRPQVIYRYEGDVKLEPYENLWVELPNDNLGDVLQNLAARKAEITNMVHQTETVMLEAIIPTRGLIGFESWLTNTTSGHGISGHLFKEYAKVCGPIPSRNNGTLVCAADGVATGYALDTIQQRGKLFIGPQDDVYVGMVIGENARSEDLPVNPTRTKQLTNVRASGTDKAIMLEPPIKMSLEKALEFISTDEYVEATPKALRLRKKILDPSLRKRMAKSES